MIQWKTAVCVSLGCVFLNQPAWGGSGPLRARVVDGVAALLPSQTARAREAKAGVDLADPDPKTRDPDEQPEHQERMREIVAAAKQKKVERDRIDDKRRPLLKELNPLIAEQKGLLQELDKATQLAKKASQEIDKQDRIISNSNDPNTINNANVAKARARQIYDDCDLGAQRINSRLAVLKPQITGLQSQLVALEAERTSLMKEVVQLRLDWVAIRRPDAKFARADYETLFHAADDWIRLDPDYPDAYVWRGLASWELGRAEEGLQDARKAMDIWDDAHQGAKKKTQWSWGMAVYGMMLTGNPKTRKEGESWITKARAGNGAKNPVVHHLSGISQHNLKKESQAAAQYRKALKENADYVPSLHRLAQLHSEAADSKVRNPEEAVTLAERAWTISGNRSWRILEVLVVAYAAAGQQSRSIDALDRFKVLCPASERERVQKLEERIRGSTP